MTDGVAELVHRLHELGTGYGGVAITTILRTGQLGKRRLLVLAVARAYRDGPRALQVNRALALFEAVERTAPQAAEQILSHPTVDAWATRYLNGSGTPDLGYLSAMAAAAAIRAGIPFQINIPCPNGRLFLPTLGAAHGLGDGVAVVFGGVGRVDVTGPRGPAVKVGDDPRWLPIRHITTASQGLRLALEIEDLDPYRAGYPWPPTHRLPPERADRLASLVGEAWAWIVAHCPRHAPAIVGLLRAIVPVEEPCRRRQVSAATRTACGAIALSEPRDADTIALLMIHEIQHAKLGAVMDLVDLHVLGGPARYRAPWRLDPRPVGALLQGAYAHLGVTDVWRSRRVRPWGGTTPVADFEFAYWRAQTSKAVSILRESGELTPSGADFVGAMAETLAAWKKEPLPASVAAAVGDVDRAGAVRWRLRNVVPDPGDVARLVAAWRAGSAAAAAPPGPPRSGPPRPADLDGLAAEIARRASAARAVAAPLWSRESGEASISATPDTPEPGNPSPGLIALADWAFLAADYARAAVAYRRRLALAPDDDRAWIGLLLSLSREALDSGVVKSDSEIGNIGRQVARLIPGESKPDSRDGKLAAAVRGLLARPELVKAVYATLVGDSGPTPDDVAAWLVGYQAREPTQSGGGSM